ncbi:12-oxophytodienoate reductase [Croceicoccus estronivorus]|uniref:NADH:flavin oxidoreductase n=1 Tax=Croceicoccus estronivorus TaxID=1172626 RepID=UPI000832B6F8|nr:NADH:flavin oxidoreductase [Croceicoccus estronivorus]OCC23725.1 12-oxophytodienoate reductase [Croceicoccus estronivorus]
MTEVAALFTPTEAAGIALPNRIVMAPMTRRMAPDGIVGQNVADYYVRRASAAVGLIVTEGIWIDHPSASNARDVPHIYGEAALAAWARVVDQVHATGAKIAAQLWHVGSLASDSTSDSRPERILSPSGFYREGVTVGEPMTQAEIDAVIDAYASGVVNAKAAGFDAVEFHGAHGYLIDQFLWARTNLRRDAYGGDLRARTRFAAEIIAECRRRVGPDFPLILRISQFKYEAYDYKHAESPAELTGLVEPLVDAGVSIFHCSQRRFWEPEFADSDRNLAGWVKAIGGKPTITVGSVGLSTDSISTNYLEAGTPAAPSPLTQLLRMLDRGDFDLVAVGRALLQDWEWARKIRDNRIDELRAYTAEAVATYY